MYYYLLYCIIYSALNLKFKYNFKETVVSLCYIKYVMYCFVRIVKEKKYFNF